MLMMIMIIKTSLHLIYNHNISLNIVRNIDFSQYVRLYNIEPYKNHQSLSISHKDFTLLV